jgi:hypothetical protein
MPGQIDSSVQRRLDQLEARLRVAEDHLEIMRLLSAYGPAVDTGRAVLAAEQWVAEGVYAMSDIVTARGTRQISALYEDETHLKLVRQGCAHVMSPPHIKVDGDRAHAVGYSFVLLRGEDGWQVWRASSNAWDFVRTPGGWRIAERRNHARDGSERSQATLEECPA